METLLQAVNALERSCDNCGTHTTPQWRPGNLCNACSMYYRRNGCHRHIDPISLEAYDMRYDVVTDNGSHHDARQLAAYILSGGILHPLSRRRFSAYEVRDIYEKVRSTKIGKQFRKLAVSISNRDICNRLGWQRAAQFLQVIAAEAPRKAADTKAYLELVVCSEFMERSEGIAPSPRVIDAICETRYTDEDITLIQSVVIGTDLNEKCDFLSHLPFTPIDIDPKLAEFLAEYFVTHNIKTCFIL